jgi:hypothetical protein
VDLGLSIGEFWALLPVEFFAMLRRWSDREKARRRDHYTLVATVRNALGDPCTVYDLTGEKPPSKEQIVKALLSQLQKPDGDKHQG